MDIGSSGADHNFKADFTNVLLRKTGLNDSIQNHNHLIDVRPMSKGNVIHAFSLEQSWSAPNLRCILMRKQMAYLSDNFRSV